MASIYGYVILLVGLSLLLGLAGVPTQGKGILNMFGIGITSGSVTGIENFSTDIALNPFQGTVLAILLGLAGFAVASLALRFDLGASLKVGAAITLLTIMATEFRAIMLAAGSYDTMGGMITLVAIVIYLPIAIGTVITAFNWIGGNN